MMVPKPATESWLALMKETLEWGVLVAPRGKATKELLQQTICVDMRQPVVQVPKRKLNYKFMAAEAYWILSGDNTVAGIAPYNSKIADYSDNGETFFGAYGPRIRSQLDYVVRKLKSDEHTRQAGLTIWRENPPETKDYPCTIAMFFNRRGYQLNCHVFMRSSDQWLGVPYDIFNFSCVAYLVCCRLNKGDENDVDVKPGNLYLTAASSHLYQPNWADATDIVQLNLFNRCGAVPRRWYTNEQQLMKELDEYRRPLSRISSHWWEA